jgi:hypothetical protein
VTFWQLRLICVVLAVAPASPVGAATTVVALAVAEKAPAVMVPWTR